MFVPWLFVLLYYLYYRKKRVAELPAEAVYPLQHFLNVVTEGATAGFDRRLMSLFHPQLLGKTVDRGVVRAMVRGVCERLGQVVSVPCDTVAVKEVGNEAHIIALVNFEHAKGVRCRMSWEWRLRRKSAMQFHVTAFRIEPPPQMKFDVLEYLNTEDFTYFAETFVERLFQRPPRLAVDMMISSLREKYSGDLDKLQKSVESVCGAPLSGMADPNVTLLSATVLRTSDADPAASNGTVQGLEMRFHVDGVGNREMHVLVVVVIADLRCYVGKYEVRSLPDTRTQVLVDTDTGERLFVG
ncbi:hypothetical protein ERJ75_001601600 [Trypanosoma vivax]|nr:hypothetical protein ERJ75_001601600 [Trypanosoma vivax]